MDFFITNKVQVYTAREGGGTPTSKLNGMCHGLGFDWDFGYPLNRVLFYPWGLRRMSFWNFFFHLNKG